MTMTPEERQVRRRESRRKYREANRAKIREYGRRRYAANREEIRAGQREYEAANPEKALERGRRYYAAHPEKVRERSRQYYRANAEKERERDRRYRQRLRAAVFDHYGHVCACPGCDATENLTIDHVNGDGREHRLELFGRNRGIDSPRFYRWLIKNGFPPGHQVLCAPCNSSKHDGPRCRLDHARAA